MSKKVACVFFALFLMFLLASAYVRAAAQSGGASGYHLIKKVKLGGSGGWDYLEVDAATHRLCISRATHVIVVDPDQGKIIGDIPDTQGVHGIAFANEFNKGFTTNGRTSDSTVFDLTSLKSPATPRPTRIPAVMSYDPFSKRASSLSMATRIPPGDRRRFRTRSPDVSLWRRPGIRRHATTRAKCS